MKTLFLLRHADADAPNSKQSDIDRRLSDRGRVEAAGLPARFAHHAALPNHCLCSTARRAVETLDGLRNSIDWRPETTVEIDPALYLASSEALLEQLSWVEDEMERVLLVAHNPGIAQLAHELSRSGDPAALGRLRKGFRPAALAVLEFDFDRWADIESRQGRLIDLSSPG